jgi:hypothetical protein
MSIIPPEIPEGFDCLNGLGPHLQLQFIYYSDGKITMADKAHVFRNSVENGGDRNVYPSSGEVLVEKNDSGEYPVGMMLFGMQYSFQDVKDYRDFQKGFDPDEKTYPGIRCGISETRFFNIAVSINNKLNESQGGQVRNYLFKHLNFSKDFKKIESVTLTERVLKYISPN